MYSHSPPYVHLLDVMMVCQDEDSPIVHIEEGAVLELQKCLDDTITQWWSFDLDKGRLHNAADEIYIADMQGEAAAGSAAGTPAVDNGFAISICRDGYGAQPRRNTVTRCVASRLSGQDCLGIHVLRLCQGRIRQEQGCGKLGVLCQGRRVRRGDRGATLSAPSARLYVHFVRLFSAPVDPILTLPLRLNSALITDKANGSSSQVSHARY